MKSRSSRSRVTHDRWLVSYADFITLLFGFFVVLYAFARADQEKQIKVSQAIDSAFRSMNGLRAEKQPNSNASSGGSDAASMREDRELPTAVAVLAPAEIKDDLDRLRRDLSRVLASQVASHAVSVDMRRDGLVISLREAGFFDSGSATPRPETIPALRQIALLLGATPYDVRIEGHTDNVPVHNAEFDSNWELSSARATRIARLILAMNVIPPDRLSAAGYGEYHPVSSNATPEGRAQNRRVDLVVMPRTQFNFAGPGVVAATEPWRKVTDGE